MDTFLENLYGGAEDWISGVYNMMISQVLNVAKFGVAEQTVVAEIFNAVLPAGVALLVAFSLYSILSTVIEKGDNITVQMLVGPLIRCVLGLVLLNNAAKIMGYLMGMSNWFVDNAVNVLEIKGKSGMNVTEIPGNWFVKVFLLAFAGVAGRISAIFASIVVTINAITTKIEMAIRLAMLPFGIANLCGHEHRGGISYLKKLIANAFFMFVIVAEIYIINVISFKLLSGLEMDWSSPLQAIEIYLVIALAGPFACCSAVALSKAAIMSALE